MYLFCVVDNIVKIKPYSHHMMFFNTQVHSFREKTASPSTFPFPITNQCFDKLILHQGIVVTIQQKCFKTPLHLRWFPPFLGLATCSDYPTMQVQANHN